MRVVKAYMNLLVGIHIEVTDLLKDKQIAPGTLRKLRQVNGVRQLEIAELLVAANNYSAGYVEALILGTPQDQLRKVAAKKNPKGFSLESIARMEQEMEMLEREFKAVEKGYGENVLHLTLARACIRKLLENVNVASLLRASYGTSMLNLRRLPAPKPCHPRFRVRVLFIRQAGTKAQSDPDGRGRKYCSILIEPHG